MCQGPYPISRLRRLPASIDGATPTLTAGGANGGLGPNGKKMITNYEVDKTVRVVRGATAVVRRVTAAVVINNTSSEVQGEDSQQTPF